MSTTHLAARRRWWQARQSKRVTTDKAHSAKRHFSRHQRRTVQTAALKGRSSS